jgi:hypothetical protein
MKNILPALIAVVLVGGALFFLLRQVPAPTAPVVATPPPALTTPSEVSAEENTPGIAAPETATPSATEPGTGVQVAAAPEPVAAVATADAAEAAEIHVAAGAGPGGDGSPGQPFATLEEARDAAVEISDRPVHILIGPGHYLVRRGFRLTDADSGSADRRIVYRGQAGGGTRISSGVIVPLDKLAPVTDEAIRARLRDEVRDRVRQVSLAELGVEPMPLSDHFRGLELLEVFWNGKRQPLSRWPDAGKFARIKTVLDNGIEPPANGTFVYREDEPGNWSAAVEEGLWLRGFWRVPWIIEAVRVGELDPEEKTITLAAPVPNGIGSKYHRAANNGPGPGSGEEPWEAVNLIEEISTSGEWAVRFADQSLYLLPPGDAGELLVTESTRPILHLKDASFVTLENLAVDAGLGDGILVEGGEGVVIAGCRVSNVARNGIVLKGGTGHTIQSCDTAETGYSGISYLGGDRRTLTPGRHRIVNNIVSRTGLFYPAPGINGGLATRAEAVGNLIAHNRIHDCMNSGIVYGGNDNIFEYNEIYRVGLGSSDLGCFYTNAGWTSRGNIIRYNLVHHSMNANAFYVDDGDAGDTFINNVAYKTATGPFIGGGHDQIFVNNIIAGSPIAVHIDARGIPRGYTVTDKRLRADLDSVPYDQPPWSEKYPQLAGILETATERPARIVVEDNLIVACGTPLRKSDGGWQVGGDNAFEGLSFEGNVVSDDLAIFVDAENLDFTLRKDAPIFQDLPDFPQFPTDKIGPQPDEYRAEIPPRDMEKLRNESTEGGFDSQTDVDATNRQ